MRSTFIVALVLLAACNNDVSSTEAAQKAYQGLDPSVDKAISLGFAGYNEVGGAPGANIGLQSADGGVSGTLTVGGKVDNGNSTSSKIMNLTDALSNYSDDGKVTYNTDNAALPALDMSLKSLPNGTVDGTLNGSFMMSGDLSGQVSLALTFTGQTETDGGIVLRKVGTTHITGTATSPAGTYNVNVTR